MWHPKFERERVRYLRYGQGNAFTSESKEILHCGGGVQLVLKQVIAELKARRKMYKGDCREAEQVIKADGIQVPRVLALGVARGHLAELDLVIDWLKEIQNDH